MRRFFTPGEIALWWVSCTLITVSFLCTQGDLLTLAASLLGATMLLLLAKGHPAGQIMTILFALLYAVISYRFRYYGEMMTYLGMTAPTAALAAVSWIKNPYEKGRGEVKVAPLTRGKGVGLLLSAVAVTALFHGILARLHTANLPVSTLSVTTSYLASALTVLRSPLYALAYGANDVVLIALWTLAARADASYLPMVLCFAVFLVNDAYGYYNWRTMQRRQSAAD